MAEEEIGKLFGVPIVADDSLPEGAVLVREHRKGGGDVTSDKEALSFLDKLRGRTAGLAQQTLQPTLIRKYTYVCNKGDHDRLIQAVRLVSPRHHLDFIAFRAEQIAGVKIVVKPGVRARGHFLDEEGKRVKED